MFKRLQDAGVDPTPGRGPKETAEFIKGGAREVGADHQGVRRAGDELMVSVARMSAATSGSCLVRICNPDERKARL